MSTTGFITHGWTSAPFEGVGAGLRPSRSLLRGLVWLLCALLLGWSAARAQTPAHPSVLEMAEFRTERSDTQWLVHAQLKLELGSTLEEALQKGLAIHFVAETEVLRERWYWTDRKVASASRHYRLAFQPLTRRWRLHVSAQPLTDAVLSSGLAQTYDSLAQAVQVMSRQSQWPVAELSALEPGARHLLRYRFRLDTSQLPRPFQIASGNNAEWALSVGQEQRWTPEAVR